MIYLQANEMLPTAIGDSYLLAGLGKRSAAQHEIYLDY